MEFTYQSNFIPAPHYVIDLYHNVGWQNYTSDEPKLIRALNQSLCVITAWQDTDLIGLIRAVGDGESILYIQDILVRKEFQRHGVGSRLIHLLFEKYPGVRQKVLLTDNTPETTAFYKKLGFREAGDAGYAAFLKIEAN